MSLFGDVFKWGGDALGFITGQPEIAAAGNAIGAGIDSSGFGNTVGSIGGSLLNAYESRNSANTARDFAASQSATQHQREVVDLEKAGLNPVLSANMGGNAAAISPMAQINTQDQSLQGAQSNASQIALQKAQMDNLSSQSALNKANAANAAMSTASTAQSMRIKNPEAIAGDAVTSAANSAKSLAVDAGGFFSHPEQSIDSSLQSVTDYLGLH